MAEKKNEREETLEEKIGVIGLVREGSLRTKKKKKEEPKDEERKPPLLEERDEEPEEKLDELQRRPWEDTLETLEGTTPEERASFYSSGSPELSYDSRGNPGGSIGREALMPLYGEGVALNPRERVWIDNRRWNEGLESGGMRDASGRLIPPKSDRIEGEVVLSEGIREGFTAMTPIKKQKSDYEPIRG